MGWCWGREKAGLRKQAWILSVLEQSLPSTGPCNACFLSSACRHFLDVIRKRRREEQRNSRCGGALRSASALAVTRRAPSPRLHAGIPARRVALANRTVTCDWSGTAGETAGDRLAGWASSSAGKGRIDRVICLVTGEPHGKKMGKPSA